VQHLPHVTAGKPRGTLPRKNIRRLCHKVPYKVG
jgi:hypothetical protein